MSMVEKRSKIINNLIKEITEKINKNFFDLTNLENDLKKYPLYFSNSELNEYIQKIEEIKFLDFNENQKKEDLDTIIYYFLDIRNFLVDLKERRGKFIRKLIEECINSIYNQKQFFYFVVNSEFYFENYSYYFTNEEIKKYDELWFELEIENSMLLSDENVSKIMERWNKNCKLILVKVIKMIQYLNSLELD
ncbi:hypothetical protein [Fusobacterium animalis]|uniref:hypothetical protein n=1 Tax=Fusobacterium animalis TaxID=76859 RepID=UPI0034DFB036